MDRWRGKRTITYRARKRKHTAKGTKKHPLHKEEREAILSANYSRITKGSAMYAHLMRA